MPLVNQHKWTKLNLPPNICITLYHHLDKRHQRPTNNSSLNHQIVLWSEINERLHLFHKSPLRRKREITATDNRITLQYGQLSIGEEVFRFAKTLTGSFYHRTTILLLFDLFFQVQNQSTDDNSTTLATPLIPELKNPLQRW